MPPTAMMNAEIAPCWEFPFGTDAQGRDIFSRILYGARVSLTVGIVSQTCNSLISVTLGPVLNSKESLLGVVAVFRDITREVESDRLKTEFIGTVSHELRTPMTSIKGFTQLLAMGSLGPVNDTQKEFLQIIQTNAERMITIINDMSENYELEFFRSQIKANYPDGPPLSAVNMGQLGQLSRALNTVFSPITHPLLPIVAAPGQLSAAEINGYSSSRKMR